MSKHWSGIVVVWVLAVLSAVLIAVLSSQENRISWAALGLAGCTIVTLAIQIAQGEKDGYVSRVISSISGAVIVYAIATAIFVLVGLV
ncbi:hypothetical protein [Leifsonia sp. A12D58]|uniref:hypothetical protein n=1 Tax=Leifsonia sp. A12D58 TaxID=3397674 RepID=UPI0039DF6762